MSVDGRAVRVSRWSSPLLAAAAALLAGSVALSEGQDQRIFAGAGAAVAFLLIGVFVARDKDA